MCFSKYRRMAIPNMYAKDEDDGVHLAKWEFVINCSMVEHNHGGNIPNLVKYTLQMFCFQKFYNVQRPRILTICIFSKKKHFWQRSSKNWPLRPLTFSPKHISSKDWPIRGNQQLGGEILQPQVSPGLLLNSSGWKAKQLGNDLKDKSDPIEYCGPCCEFFSGLFRRPYYDPYIIIDWFYWKLTGLVLVGWLAGWLVGMILAVLLGKKWFSLLWINPNISEKYFGKERI